MVAISGLIALAGLTLPAVLAIKVGRYEMPLAARTVLPRDEIGAWSAAPTPPPNPRFAVMALKREAGGPTCGYYEFSMSAPDSGIPLVRLLTVTQQTAKHSIATPTKHASPAVATSGVPEAPRRSRLVSTASTPSAPRARKVSVRCAGKSHKLPKSLKQA